ncbi:Copper amine oxidase N-terminal domain-containing protein [Caldanaerovirga acetigignens]|uniref:Copper amine oxidase N-terminal domain-containing protein n=1 Tax=Caldanaerovirga acetigignens TaxID=447595 RepID=A0A1M7MLG1_9FIRM|nr:copper amine oxidase N-terminal domain-containing protein [Caldanaerovirga acetigignens]SHM91834.1 Copper amine oxidase N-terminal domain-containing protein [Caldanaerovirga acetigignens]
MIKKLPLYLLIVCVLFVFQPVIKADDINYDDIKLLYVGPYVDYGPFKSSEPKVLENVPRYIFPYVDQRPFIKNGKTYLPLRLIFDILGYHVYWKKDDGSIAIYNEQEKMVLNTSTKKITIGDKVFDIPLLLVNDRYFIPLRDFSKVSGDSIMWDEDTRTVIYVKKGSKFMKPSVTITKVEYDTASNYAEVSCIVKNTSGETIPKTKLVAIGDTVGGRSLTFATDFYRNRDKDIIENELIPLSFLVEKGTYNIIIVGVYDKDSYLKGISFSIGNLP